MHETYTHTTHICTCKHMCTHAIKQSWKHNILEKTIKTKNEKQNNKRQKVYKNTIEFVLYQLSTSVRSLPLSVLNILGVTPLQKLILPSQAGANCRELLGQEWELMFFFPPHQCWDPIWLDRIQIYIQEILPSFSFEWLSSQMCNLVLLYLASIFLFQ